MDARFKFMVSLEVTSNGYFHALVSRHTCNKLSHFFISRVLWKYDSTFTLTDLQLDSTVLKYYSQFQNFHKVKAICLETSSHLCHGQLFMRHLLGLYLQSNETQNILSSQHVRKKNIELLHQVKLGLGVNRLSGS